jgi:hypothetical protein
LLQLPHAVFDEDYEVFENRMMVMIVGQIDYQVV